LNDRISYWLLPRKEERTYFQKLIIQIAEKYGAQPFIPHLTLYVGRYYPQDDPGEIVEKALQGVKPLSLEIDKIRYSDEVTKTLYISFFPHEALKEIHRELRESSTIASDYRLDPHMSLIYHPLTNSEKELLAGSIHIHRSNVVFDQVWAVSTPDFRNDRVEVDLWEVICKRSLSSNTINHG